MPSPRIPAALTTLALAAGLAACGGSKSSSTVSASAYAKSLCSAIGPFETHLRNRLGSLHLSANPSPAQGKAALERFYAGAAADSDSAVSQLRAAGTPDVPKGKEIASTILGAFEQVQTAMHKAQTQAGSLPTGSVSSFRAGAATLSTTLAGSMSNIDQKLQASTLKSPQLVKAATREPACRALGGA